MGKPEIYERAAYVRGSFINQVAFIEKMMEYFIAFHFCKDSDRAHEMVELLTGDRFVSFESKRTTFEIILKKHYTDVYISNKENFEFLTTIQRERNKFAHLLVVVNDESIKKYEKNLTVGFYKFGEKTKPIWYEPDFVNELYTKADIVANWIQDLAKQRTP